MKLYLNIISIIALWGTLAGREPHVQMDLTPVSITYSISNRNCRNADDYARIADFLQKHSLPPGVERRLMAAAMRQGRAISSVSGRFEFFTKLSLQSKSIIPGIVPPAAAAYHLLQNKTMLQKIIFYEFLLNNHKFASAENLRKNEQIRWNDTTSHWLLSWMNFLSRENYQGAARWCRILPTRQWGTKYGYLLLSKWLCLFRAVFALSPQKNWLEFFLQFSIAFIIINIAAFVLYHKRHPGINTLFQYGTGLILISFLIIYLAIIPPWRNFAVAVWYLLMLMISLSLLIYPQIIGTRKNNSDHNEYPSKNI